MWWWSLNERGSRKCEHQDYEVSEPIFATVQFGQKNPELKAVFLQNRPKMWSRHHHGMLLMGVNAVPGAKHPKTSQVAGLPSGLDPGRKSSFNQ